MADKRWESLIDAILEKLRNNTNILTQAFPQFLYSNFTRIPKEIPLYNHHVEHLPDAAATKLTEIELLLKPHLHPPLSWEVIEDLIRRFTKTSDYSILEAALAKYRTQFQEHG
ncbi:MAG: hypothetical protein WBX01_00185 [Nitrososphaeraceae archaeon]|jgi:hypothetical protein